MPGRCYSKPSSQSLDHAPNWFYVNPESWYQNIPLLYGGSIFGITNRGFIYDWWRNRIRHFRSTHITATLASTKVKQKFFAKCLLNLKNKKWDYKQVSQWKKFVYTICPNAEIHVPKCCFSPLKSRFYLFLNKLKHRKALRLSVKNKLLSVCITNNTTQLLLVIILGQLAVGLSQKIHTKNCKYASIQ